MSERCVFHCLPEDGHKRWKHEGDLLYDCVLAYVTLCGWWNKRCGFKI